MREFFCYKKCLLKISFVFIQVSHSGFDEKNLFHNSEKKNTVNPTVRRLKFLYEIGRDATQRSRLKCLRSFHKVIKAALVEQSYLNGNKTMEIHTGFAKAFFYLFLRTSV